MIATTRARARRSAAALVAMSMTVLVACSSSAREPATSAPSDSRPASSLGTSPDNTTTDDPTSTEMPAVDDTTVTATDPGAPAPPTFNPAAFAREMKELSAELPADVRAAARSLAHTVIAGSETEAVVAAAELMRRSGFSIVSVDGSVIGLPIDATFSDIPIAAELISDITTTVRAGSLYSVESVGNLLFHLETLDAPMPWPQLAVAVASWGKDDEAPAFIVSAAAALRALSGERGQVFSSEMPEAEQGLDALQLMILLGHAGGVPVPVPATTRAAGFAASATVVARPPGLVAADQARAATPPAPTPERCAALKKQLSPEDATALAKLGIDLGKWGWGKAVDHSIAYWSELASLPGSGSADLKLANGLTKVLKAYGVANTVASYISIVMLLLGATLELKTDKPTTHYKHEDGSRAEEVTAMATARFESILSQQRLACFGFAGLDVPKDGPLAGINVRWSLGQDLRPSTTGELASSAHLRPTAASVPKFTLDQTDTAGNATVVLKPAVEDEPGQGAQLKGSVTLVAHLEKGELPFSLSDLLLVLEMDPASAVIGKTIEGLKSIAIDELLPTAKVTIGVKYHGAEPVVVKIENSVNLILYEIPRVYADLYSCTGIEGPYLGPAGYSAVGIGGFGQWSSEGLGAIGLPQLPTTSPAQENQISVLANPTGQPSTFLIAQGDGGPFLEGAIEIHPEAVQTTDNPFGWVTFDVGDGRQGQVVGSLELLLGGNSWPFSDLTGTIYRVGSDPRCPPSETHFDDN